MAGRRVLLALCWPLLLAPLALKDALVSFLCLHLWAFWVCLESYVFLIVESFLSPTVDPYVPRAKRPPAYLTHFFEWLNASINHAADRIALCISVRRTWRPSTSSSGPSCTPNPPCFFNLLSLHATSNSIPVKCWAHQYLFDKWHSLSYFLRYKERLRFRTTILALSVATTGVARAHSANSAAPYKSKRAIFDSDSFGILVDGGATACISNNIADFIKPPKTSAIKVKGFNGSSSSTRAGTVSWTVLDDTGYRRTLTIPNTYYVPACPLRLLSPQHYSQEINDLRGTYSTNFGNHVLFVWSRGRYRATLPLSSSSNVRILRSAPGNEIFSHFVGLTACPALFTPAVVSDDEADSLESEYDSDASSHEDTTSLEGEDEGDSNPTDPPLSQHPSETSDPVQDRPTVIPFDLDHDVPTTNVPNQDDATSSLDATSELMRWHCRLGHLPFANIRIMASRGELPKRLASHL
jgi:hypothetical protein